MTNVLTHPKVIERIDAVWPLVAPHFACAISAQATVVTQPSLLLERHVVSVLRLCSWLTPSGDSRAVDTTLSVLRPLTEMGMTQKEILGERVTAGLLMMLKLNGSLIRDEATWRLIFEICKTYARHSSEVAWQAAFESTQLVLTELSGTLQQYGELLPLAIETVVSFHIPVGFDEKFLPFREEQSLSVLKLLLAVHELLPRVEQVGVSHWAALSF
jgi:hypothetical protein